MKLFSTHWTVIAGLCAVAACSGKNDQATGDSSGSSANAPAAGAGAAAAPASAAPAASAPAAPAPMTDASILAAASVGDSAEVAIAKYMADSTTNAGVKAYAKELERDHGKGMSEVTSVAKKASITMQLAPDDTTSQGTSHVLDHLRSLNGADRDSAFVNHEIVDHKHDIDENQKMTAAAQSPAVKAMLQKELPELRKHLAAAEKLAKQPAPKK